MSDHPSYHYVTHRDTEQQAYRINEGKFSGVVWLYENVRFPIYDDNPTDEDLSTNEFQQAVGDILLNIIEESLEHDQVEFRTNDSF